MPRQCELDRVYIKASDEDAFAAMQLFEKSCASAAAAKNAASRRRYHGLKSKSATIAQRQPHKWYRRGRRWRFGRKLFYWFSLEGTGGEGGIRTPGTAFDRTTV